jgi:hypothetical protein
MFSGLKFMWLEFYRFDINFDLQSSSATVHLRTARLICAYCNRMKESVMPAI